MVRSLSLSYKILKCTKIMATIIQISYEAFDGLTVYFHKFTLALYKQIYVNNFRIE
jgi:hypothetical protein